MNKKKDDYPYPYDYFNFKSPDIIQSPYMYNFTQWCKKKGENRLPKDTGNISDDAPLQQRIFILSSHCNELTFGGLKFSLEYGKRNKASEVMTDKKKGKDYSIYLPVFVISKCVNKKITRLTDLTSKDPFYGEIYNDPFPYFYCDDNGEIMDAFNVENFLEFTREHLENSGRFRAIWDDHTGTQVVYAVTEHRKKSLKATYNESSAYNKAFNAGFGVVKNANVSCYYVDGTIYVVTWIFNNLCPSIKHGNIPLSPKDVTATVLISYLHLPRREKKKETWLQKLVKKIGG